MNLSHLKTLHFKRTRARTTSEHQHFTTQFDKELHRLAHEYSMLKYQMCNIETYHEAVNHLKARIQ